MSTSVGTQVGRVVWHDHVSNDPNGAKGFYTELLGWGIETWKPGEADYPMIQANGQSHGGFIDPGQEVPAHWIAYVLVENVDEATSRAEKAGGTVHVQPRDLPDVGRMSVIGDPQGGAIAIFSPQGEAPESAGTFVWDELMATDVEGAKAFYGEVFGWTTAAMDMGEAGTYHMLKRAGDADAGGLMQKPAEAPGPPAAWLTYLAADDVDAAAKKAGELGGTVHREPWDIPNVGRLAIIADPTGAVFGLFKPSESS